MNRSMQKRCGIWGVWLAAMVLLLCGGCSRTDAPTAAPIGELALRAESMPGTEQAETTTETPATWPTARSEGVEDMGQAAGPPLAVSPFDAATAWYHQEAWAQYLGLPVELIAPISKGVELKMVLIPPGEFMMGSPELEQGRWDDEGPQHRVRITRPFYLGVYPVTQSQWESVMGSNPSHFSAGGDGSARVSGISTVDLPVERVSWEDVQKFIGRLNERSEEKGRVYRLATEAEWEYACRAGSTTAYCFGDSADSLGDYAWYLENSGARTYSVGQKKPNAWHLYDMHGNVFEWCADWYDSDYYANSPVDDPPGPERGSNRVYRGGSWWLAASLCRSAFRDGGSPGRRGGSDGFRLAMAVSTSSP